MANLCNWYLREDYDNLRNVMDDGQRWPPTFDEWEKRAKRQVAEAAHRGFILKPVVLNSEKFVIYCQQKKIPRGSKERGMFAIERAIAESLN